MTGPDVAEQVVDELKHYFSAPIARALLMSTLRRAKLDGGLSARTVPDAIAALERTLPMYIADAVRRGECLGRLRRLIPPVASVPEVAKVPSVPIAPPAADAGASASPTFGSACLVSHKASSDAPPSSRRLVLSLTAATSTVIQVKTADDVANASEVARDLARRVGFVHVQQTKIATAIAELGRNIILYAETGAVHMAGIDAPRPGVEVLAVDEGPGIADIQLVVFGNYRSRTGMGMGLRGAKRLMDTFEIESSPRGTSVLMRKFVT